MITTVGFRAFVCAIGEAQTEGLGARRVGLASERVAILAVALEWGRIRVRLGCQAQRGQNNARHTDPEFLQRSAARNGLSDSFG